MNPFNTLQSRREFFTRGRNLLGSAALTSLLGEALSKQASAASTHAIGPHFPPKAKRVIYLNMVGGPSQMDLLDYKPEMMKWYDKDLPDSIRQGQRLTTMTSGQARFPIAPSKFKFSQAGECGMWMNTELLPNLAKKADDLCFMRTLHTEAINHEPAIAAMQTGNQVGGRPCLGSWSSYGLGSMNDNLPTFVVLVAVPSNREQEQAISARLWSSGFLPGEHAGVSFRSSGDPILYINNPPGVPDSIRKRTIDGLNQLNELNYQINGDPETQTRIKQYEMAFRMQASVPELVDLSKESKATLEMYGPEATNPGTFAHSALLARRLVERGTRVVQILHRGWDQHGNLPKDIASQCRDTDQACAGLIKDLKERGMLDDTLVVWGGEFGRTVYSQGTLTDKNYGRDHHPRCFTMWMAGGGIKGGVTHGETDDYSYNVVSDPVHINEINATILHLMGIDHTRFSFKFQGLDQRLTGVEEKHVLKSILA